MWQFLGLTAIQCFLLAVGQVLLKIALEKVGDFRLTAAYFGRMAINGWFIAHIITFISASLLWWYILKKHPLSAAYPLGAMSYVFALVISILILHEHVTALRWVGALLIVAGCVLIAK